MGNAAMDTQLLDRAMAFAIKAHANTERRGHGYPYIVHPMEAAAICATMTPDQEILAAAVLHDVVEDTDCTLEDIRAEFGERVAMLVGNESEPPMAGSQENTWKARKQHAIDHLAGLDRDSKIVAMGDKLSNMRGIYRDFKEQGDGFWNIFHNTDPYEHEWHYRGLAESLASLADTFAYREFVGLIDETFIEACKELRLDYDDDMNLTVAGHIDEEDAKVIVGHLYKDRPTTMDWSHVGAITPEAQAVLDAAAAEGYLFEIL